MSIAPGLVSALADRYRIERELGAGGMATVYLAHDLKHDREVAVKVLRPELAALLGRERFLNEIRLTAKLDHPHILTLIDSGETEGHLWYVLPYIRGESLRARLDRERQLDIDGALGITRQIAGALNYAHQKGIIHRDVKPENILLHEGEAVLADFGIALAVSEAGGSRLTETGLAIGSPLYMSPEQATGDRQLDARTDIYSLGAVLYEMLTGEPPHTGNSAQAIIARLITERPAPIRSMRDTISHGIEAAVGKALARVPADRFPSAAAFVDALARSRIDAEGEARPSRWSRPVRVAVLAVSAGLAVAAIIWAVTNRSGSSRAGDAQVQLTTSGNAYLPVISPNGEQVAYDARQCSNDNTCTSSIMVRETASAVERPIVEGLDYAWPFQWSRDGLWLLFSGSGPGRPLGIFCVSRLGGETIRLNDGIANFLPQGDTLISSSSVVASSTRPIYLHLLPPPWNRITDSVAITPLLGFNPSAIRVPPSGRWMAIGWWNPLGTITVLTMQNRAGQWTDSMTVARADMMRWSPDEKFLILPLAGDETGGARSGSMLRIAVNPRTGKFGSRDTVAIGSGITSSSAYDLSGDGHSLVYASGRRGQTTLTSFEESRAGQRQSREVTTSSSPMDAFIALDGRQIYFVKATSTGDSIEWQWFAEPFDSSTARPLFAPLPDYNDRAADDQRFYVALPVTGGGATIAAFDLRSGQQKVIAQEPGSGFHMTAGPEGSLLLVSPNGDTVRRLNADGRQAWQTVMPDSLGRAAGLLLAPDQSRFITITQPLSSQPGPDGNFPVGVMVVSATTGELQSVATLRSYYFRELAWSDDGWLYFMMSTAQDQTLRWLRMRPTGKSIERLGSPPTGGCTLSGNAKRWVCLKTQYLSDLFLVRNLRLQ